MNDRTDPNGLPFDRAERDVEAIKRSIANRLTYSAGKDPLTATDRDWLHSVARVVRDRMMEYWMETMRRYYREDVKRVYYLSMEFLIGRILTNSLLNMGLYDVVSQAAEELGVDLEQIKHHEPDAALGNGGLGRLAACFLDSMATLGLPGYGYGIRYEFGMFCQEIKDGYQVEHPDNWLRYGNPWEFPRAEVLYRVKFHGRTLKYRGEDGEPRSHWVDTKDVMAMAFDTPIPGYGAHTVNNMRLWSAKSTRDFDLGEFNEGDYLQAVQDKTESENLSKVLYPDDSTPFGRELRLKQQYFFVSATLQDILYRFNKHHDSLDELPGKVAIQLNDTHPSVAIPELMRILVDIHHLEWERAWSITRQTFAYTNHTLLPEALETWPVSLFRAVLPRHLEIIFEVNLRFLNQVRNVFPGDLDLPARVSLVEESGERRVRMSHLAIVGSHRVNGVARLHTRLMKETIFRDFDQIYPDKIIDITNGITPRRWLNQANPQLAGLICSEIGHDWVTDLDQLARVAPLAEDPSFRARFRAAKQARKATLARIIRMRIGLEVHTDSLFDVQVKRIHEYKRQLLNLLHVVTLYNRLVDRTAVDPLPRTVIFSGKAAPGYDVARQIIKLINDVAEVVNNDPRIGDRLRVAFIPNYDVSNAADIISAADLSQQISMAGTEASGTGNMKLALNGALTIGTLDGANIEIREHVGAENLFIFGLTAQGVTELRGQGYDPREYYAANEELRRALDMIGSGYFSTEDPDRHQSIVHTLLSEGDRYMVLADFADYVDCQARVETLYRDPQEWDRRALLNVANMGYFSSDRSIREYADRVWQASPVTNGSDPIPTTAPVADPSL